MRLLDRYLLRELLVPLGYCLSGFLIFWISFNLFSDLDDFQMHNLGPRDIAEYYLATLPEQMVVVLPIALLLALLYALTNHVRHHEIVAIRAAGISLWRLSAVYLATGLVLSGCTFLLNELLAPGGLEQAERILHRYDRGNAPDVTGLKRNLNFQNARDNRSWRLGTYNLRSHEVTNVTVLWQLADGSRRDLYAAWGVYTNDVWVFGDVRESVQAVGQQYPSIRQADLLPVPELTETPALIRSEIKISNLSLTQAAKHPTLSLRDIHGYLQLHPQLTRDQEAKLITQWHWRLALPWGCLTAVLIAIPFGVPSGRRNIFVGVASSIFICFAYFILQRLGLSLGVGGYLTPWVAAWMPNLFFAVLGVVLISRAR